MKASGETEGRGDGRGVYRGGLQRSGKDPDHAISRSARGSTPTVSRSERRAIPLPCDPKEGELLYTPRSDS